MSVPSARPPSPACSIPGDAACPRRRDRRAPRRRGDALAPRLGFPKALIVPHAGYIYSGAGRGARLRRARRRARHRAARRAARAGAPRGGARPRRAERRGLRHAARPHRASTARRSRALRELPQVVTSDAGARARAFARSAAAVPADAARRIRASCRFAVGMASVAEVAEVIERAVGRPGDADRHLDRPVALPRLRRGARASTRATLARIARFATDLDHEEACGATPLNGFLLARAASAIFAVQAARRVQLRRHRRRQGSAWSAIRRSRSTSRRRRLARRGGQDAARHRARGHRAASCSAGAAATVDAPWLAQAGATFVTLTKDGELRGCIGSLEARAAARRRTWPRTRVAAAFRDPRFPPLTRRGMAARARSRCRCCPRPSRCASPTKPICCADPRRRGRR